MSLVPHFNLNSFNKSALDRYGNPDDGAQIFQEILQSSSSEQILAFYGLDQNSQRQLCQQILNTIQGSEPDAVTSVLSFTPATPWDPAQELLSLREMLHQKYSIKFPAFDVAYCIFWYKKNQGLKLNRTNLSPPGKKGSFLDRLVAGLDKEHGVNWGKIISDTIKENSNIHDKQFNPLYSLPGMPCTEILNWLPAFLADDLKRFYTASGQKTFILLQRVEQLFSSTPGNGVPGCDSWLQELILHLPQVNWVLFSTVKIPWGEHSSEWNNKLQQFLAGPLGDMDTRKHLVLHGVIDKGDQDKIIAACQGIPFYLDLLLSMDLGDYNRLPTENPETIHLWILSQYLDGLSHSEQQTLEILACASVWEDELLDHLLIEFSEYFYLPSFKELSRFPFIIAGTFPGTLAMHPVMKEYLQESRSYELQQNIHQFLFHHYAALLPHESAAGTDPKEKFAFEQCCNHGFLVMSPRDFIIWFCQASIVFKQIGEYSFLLPHYEKYLPLAERSMSSDLIEMAFYLSSLGEFYFASGDYQQAERMAAEALEIRQNNLGPLEADILDSLKQMGWIYKSQNRIIESLFFFKQGFNKCQKKYGLEHPLTAAALHNLAVIYKEDSRLMDAEFYFKQALEIREKMLGSCHEETIASLNQLENLYEIQDKPEKLLALYQHSLRLRQEEMGAESIMAAEMMWRLGTCLLLKGFYREAEPLLLEALQISRGKLPPDHPIMKAIFTNTAALHQILGKFDPLEKLYLQRLNDLLGTLDPLHPELKVFLFKVAEFYQMRGHYDKIIELFEEYLQHQKKQSIPLNHDAAVILHNLGRLYKLNHCYEQAREALEQALNILKTSGNWNNSPSMADIFNHLGELYEVLEDLEDAEYCYRRVLRLTQAMPDRERSDVYEVIQKINGIRDKIRNSPVYP